jgi:hypothetical protein
MDYIKNMEIINYRPIACSSCVAKKEFTALAKCDELSFKVTHNWR